MKTLITREQYMSNSSELFQAYYSQFVTESTKRFVLIHIGLEKIMAPHVDTHLNNVEGIRMGHDGWLWDHAPYNRDLVIEAGETSQGYLPSQATRTCIGKAAARMLIAEYKLNH